MGIKQSDRELRDLLEACRAGERPSQKELYQQFFSYAMSICLHYSKSREEAQEIMNDGFMKVFNNLNRFDLESNVPFKAWFRRILINASIDYFRRQKKHQHNTDLEYASAFRTDQSPLDQISLDDILRVVQQLPPACRMVFNLYVVEGFKHHEIAEKLGVSVGASKSNLFKAKKRLQKLLGGMYPEHAKPELKKIQQYG